VAHQDFIAGQLGDHAHVLAEQVACGDRGGWISDEEVASLFVPAVGFAVRGDGDRPVLAVILALKRF